MSAIVEELKLKLVINSELRFFYFQSNIYLLSFAFFIRLRKGTKNVLVEEESSSIQKRSKSDKKKKKHNVSREEEEVSSSPSHQNVEIFVSRPSESGGILSNLVSPSSPDDSNKEGDVIINSSKMDALALLKQLVRNTKASTKKAHEKAKWDFKNCPHKQFDKTLDDTFMCFIMWAKIKKEEDDEDENENEADMGTGVEGRNNCEERYNVSRVRSGYLKRCIILVVKGHSKRFLYVLHLYFLILINYFHNKHNNRRFVDLKVMLNG